MLSGKKAPHICRRDALDGRGYPLAQTPVFDEEVPELPQITAIRTYRMGRQPSFERQELKEAWEPAIHIRR